MRVGNDTLPFIQILASYDSYIYSVFLINFVFNKIFLSINNLLFPSGFFNINNLLFPLNSTATIGYIVITILMLTIYIAGYLFFLKNIRKGWAKWILFICSTFIFVSMRYMFILFFNTTFWQMLFSPLVLGNILGLIINGIIIYYLLFVEKIYKKKVNKDGN